MRTGFGAAALVLLASGAMAQTPPPQTTPKISVEVQNQIDPASFTIGEIHGTVEGVRLSDGRSGLRYDKKRDVPSTLPVGSSVVTLPDGRVVVAADLAAPAIPYTLAVFVQPSGPATIQTGTVAGSRDLISQPIAYRHMVRLKTALTVPAVDGPAVVLPAGDIGFVAGRYHYGYPSKIGTLVCLLDPAFPSGPAATQCLLKPDDPAEPWLAAGANSLLPTQYANRWIPGAHGPTEALPSLPAPDLEDGVFALPEALTLGLRAPYWRGEGTIPVWTLDGRVVATSNESRRSIHVTQPEGMLKLDPVPGDDLATQSTFAAGPAPVDPAAPPPTVALDFQASIKAEAHQDLNRSTFREYPVAGNRGRLEIMMLTDGRQALWFSDPADIRRPLPDWAETVTLANGKTVVAYWAGMPMTPAVFVSFIDSSVPVTVKSGRFDSLAPIMSLPLRYKQTFRLKTAVTFRHPDGTSQTLPAGTTGFYAGQYDIDARAVGRMLCLFDPADNAHLKTVCVLRPALHAGPTGAGDEGASWVYAGANSLLPQSWAPAKPGAPEWIAPLDIEDGDFALPRSYVLQGSIACWHDGRTGLVWTVDRRIEQVTGLSGATGGVAPYRLRDANGKLELRPADGDFATDAVFTPAVAGQPLDQDGPSRPIVVRVN